jgi:leucyl aminopeptidase
VLLVGLGRERDFLESAYRTALAATIKALRGTGAAEAVVCLPALDVKRRDISWKSSRPCSAWWRACTVSIA